MALPGFSWRLLAHRKNGESIDLQSRESHRRSVAWWKKDMGDKPRPTEAREQVITEPSCFDEVVIDDWFHIEQMDTRVWWMRIGNARGDGKNLVVWVRIPTHGDARVTWEAE